MQKKPESLRWEGEGVTVTCRQEFCFVISVPAFGVKISQFSSCFCAVCFHAFSECFLFVSHGLGLVV